MVLSTVIVGCGCGFNKCVIGWNKAMRRILRIPHRSHRWLLAQLEQQKDLREHLHKKWLHYLIKGKLELVRLSLINIHV